MPIQPISDQPITKMCRIFADDTVECIWCKFSCGKLKTPSLTQINFCDPEIYPFVSILDNFRSKNSVHDGIK
ncbi:hypothetical protein T09_10233, partial [Trichinella sp. T9]